MFNQPKSYTLNCRGNLLHINSPIVMGILNVTPDSFFDGGKYLNENTILHQVEKMLNDGAAIIDIGGMSTKPNAAEVTEAEEINRISIISKIHQRFPYAILSIDTFRSNVAEYAVNNGASIINDISGGTEDERIFEIAAQYSCPLVLMHRQGTLQNMHQQKVYKNFLPDILDYFIQQINKTRNFGIKDVIIDVGFGFSKTIEQNYTLLKNLRIFTQLDKPMLVGLSRKSMLYKLQETTPENALNATIIANTIALQNGAAILRVHDVKEAMDCIKVFNKMNGK